MTMVTGNYFLNCLRCRGQMVEDFDGYKCCQCGNTFFTNESLDYVPNGALEYMVPAMSYSLHHPIKVMFVPVKKGTAWEGNIRLETRADCPHCYEQVVMTRKSRQHPGSNKHYLNFFCSNEHRFKVETDANDLVGWTF